jgi:hypothetical protein
MNGSRFSKSRSEVALRALVLSALCATLLAFFAIADADARRDVLPVKERGDNRASGIRATSAITYSYFLPVVSGWGCAIPGGSYGTVAVFSAPTNPPAENHPDLNLALRGYTTTVAYRGIVDLPGPPSDPGAPQLYTLFRDHRVPTFSTVYQVYDWDWNCNCRGGLITEYAVTLAGFLVAPDEAICTPGSGYDIGRRAAGYEVMVLYAAANRITLKYTREDNVVYGYTIHIENISVDPNLLALYQAMNSAGRANLPALYAGQFIGAAMGNEIQVAIRDTGSFMDPRSHYDWWQGK